MADSFDLNKPSQYKIKPVVLRRIVNLRPPVSQPGICSM